MWHLSAAAADVSDDVVLVACSVSHPQTLLLTGFIKTDSDVIKHTVDEVATIPRPFGFISGIHPKSP